MIESLFWAYSLHLTIQILSDDNAGKNKSYEKTNSEFIEFVSIPRKLNPFKNPYRLPTEPTGIHHSPHTHTIGLPIPMGIPMGIPIPTAALSNHVTAMTNDGQTDGTGAFSMLYAVAF